MLTLSPIALLVDVFVALILSSTFSTDSETVTIDETNQNDSACVCAHESGAAASMLDGDCVAGVCKVARGRDAS